MKQKWIEVLYKIIIIYFRNIAAPTSEFNKNIKTRSNANFFWLFSTQRHECLK